MFYKEQNILEVKVVFFFFGLCYSSSGAWSSPLISLSSTFFFCCCSVTQSCPTLCNSMDYSIPGFPVLHYLLEFAQTRVHWVMPSNHVILCHPFLLLLSIFPSIRVFSNESALCIRWPKYWSFSFSISLPVNIQDWFPLGLTGLISLKSKGLSRVFTNATVQKHQFFSTQISLWSNSHIHTWLLENHSFD